MVNLNSFAPVPVLPILLTTAAGTENTYSLNLPFSVVTIFLPICEPIDSLCNRLSTNINFSDKDFTNVHPPLLMSQ